MKQDETPHNYLFPKYIYNQVKLSDSTSCQPTNENLDLGGSGPMEGPSLMMELSPTLLETMQNWCAAQKILVDKISNFSGGLFSSPHPWGHIIHPCGDENGLYHQKKNKIEQVLGNVDQ